jgi:hypothetical protein
VAGDLGDGDADAPAASPCGSNDLVTTTTTSPCSASLHEATIVLTNTSCTINSGSAIRCMAAQLLTTLLDIANNGALVHSCVDTQISSGRGFLDSLGYNASSLSASNRIAILAVASTLNTWNNNGC